MIFLSPLNIAGFHSKGRAKYSITREIAPFDLLINTES